MRLRISTVRGVRTGSVGCEKYDVVDRLLSSFGWNGLMEACFCWGNEVIVYWMDDLVGGKGGGVVDVGGVLVSGFYLFGISTKQFLFRRGNLIKLNKLIQGTPRRYYGTHNFKWPDAAFVLCIKISENGKKIFAQVIAKYASSCRH